MGNMIEMTLQQAESFVYSKDSSAQYSPKGVKRNGEWYKQKVIAVSEKGTYFVSNNDAGLSPKTRNRSK
jgi:Zn-dependent M28 family amino/carboxypeptidase